MEKLEIIKLFDAAINREIEAYTFYKGVSERVTDLSVKELFEQLAAEERGHEELLRRFKSDPKATLELEPPADYKVAETVEIPALSLEMKPADAIALAMKNEQQAMELYAALADWTADEELKAIYRNLSSMELGHKTRLERLFVDIGYPEVW